MALPSLQKLQSVGAAKTLTGSIIRDQRRSEPAAVDPWKVLL